MPNKVYEILVEHFRSWGITHVFGIPGKSISPIMVECDNREIEYVLSRHECGAGYEAAGYAFTKKTIGVAIGTSGPGGTNMLTAAGQALEWNLPVLFITGHPSMRETGKALGQDSSPFGSDLVRMFEPVTRFSAFVPRSDVFQLYLKHAIEKAWTGARGPVHLCIPFDVLMEETEPFLLPLPKEPTYICKDMSPMISLLDNAQNPVLMLGKGAVAAEAFEEIQIVAEHWRIPVITTPGGAGAFPSHHPLCLGAFGLGGSQQSADHLKSGVDLMVIIGSKLSDMEISGFTPNMLPSQAIHFDLSQEFIGKSIGVETLGIVGDIKTNLKELIHAAAASNRDYDRLPVPTVKEDEIQLPLLSKTVMHILRECLPQDTYIFGDAGSHTFYMIRDFPMIQTGTFIFDETFAAMGNAIGYAVGAKIGAPDKKIVCLTGDGCLMMQGMELSTAVNQQADVICIVLNNGRLDMVDKGMSYNTGKSIGAVFNQPIHAAKFAESIGLRGFRCETPQEIREAIEQALSSGETTVVEIMVDPNEIPPILTRLLSLND